MSGEQLCRLGVHGRGGLCVCERECVVIVQRCLFPVAISTPTPSLPLQPPAFSAHRHLSPKFVRAEAGLRPLPQAGLNPTTTEVVPHIFADL